MGRAGKGDGFQAVAGARIVSEVAAIQCPELDPVSAHIHVLHGMTASCGHFMRWTRTLQPQPSTTISQLPMIIGLIFTAGLENTPAS